MSTSYGQTFLPTDRGYAHFFLTLSAKSTNIAKVSFTIHKASNAIVAFTNNTINVTRLVSTRMKSKNHTINQLFFACKKYFRRFREPSICDDFTL